MGIIARTRSQLEETAHEIEALGQRVLVIPIDIARSDEVNQAVEQVISTLGPVDILVNNAGIAEEKSLLEVTDDDWHRVMRVNLTVHSIFVGR